MKIAVFKITGVSPMLQNNPASMHRAEGGIGMKKIPSPEEESKAKVYRDDEGHFYMLTEAFRSSMVGKGGGASGRRLGKFGMASRVCAGVFTAEPRCTILDAKSMKPVKSYIIDTRRAVVQGQGVLRSRPMFENWATLLPLEIDEDFVTVKQIEELLNISGKVAGVGDFRPQRKGTFGRFSAELQK